MKNILITVLQLESRFWGIITTVTINCGTDKIKAESVPCWEPKCNKINEEDQVRITIKRMAIASRVTITYSRWASLSRKITPIKTSPNGRSNSPITTDKLTTTCCNKTKCCSLNLRSFDSKKSFKLLVFGLTKTKFRSSFSIPKIELKISKLSRCSKVGFSRKVRHPFCKMKSGRNQPLLKANKIRTKISAALFFHFQKQTLTRLFWVIRFKDHQYLYRNHLCFHLEMEKLQMITHGN